MPSVLGLKNNTTLLQDIKALLDRLDGGICLEVYECSWYIDEESVHWNTDSNLEHLYNHDGHTFSEESYKGFFEQEGLSFLTMDDSCGGEYTGVFIDALKVSYEELEEKFG